MVTALVVFCGLLGVLQVRNEIVYRIRQDATRRIYAANMRLIDERKVERILFLFERPNAGGMGRYLLDCLDLSRWTLEEFYPDVAELGKADAAFAPRSE